MYRSADSSGRQPAAWPFRFLQHLPAALAWAMAGMTLAEPATAQTWPGAQWATASPAAVGMDPAKTATALKYGRVRAGSGNLIRAGRRIGYWGDQGTKYHLQSTTKSIGSILIGIAIRERRISLDSLLAGRVPNFGVPPTANRAKGWLDGITVRQLATQSAGFSKTGGFGPLLFKPGSGWYYSDGGPNWIADLLTVKFGQDLQTVLRSRVLAPMGIRNDQIVWRRNAYRPHTLNGIERREFGSGISTNVDVMARLGLMLLRQGAWRTHRIVRTEFVREAGSHARALDAVKCLDPELCKVNPRSKQYGLLFWTNADGHIPDLPRDAYWAAGQGTSFILVIPSLDIVAARAGPAWAEGEAERYAGLVARAAR
jgi:CubicO group peptidase (beta-lactamase class C family)